MNLYDVFKSSQQAQSILTQAVLLHNEGEALNACHYFVSTGSKDGRRFNESEILKIIRGHDAAGVLDEYRGEELVKIAKRLLNRLLKKTGVKLDRYYMTQPLLTYQTASDSNQNATQEEDEVTPKFEII